MAESGEIQELRRLVQEDETSLTDLQQSAILLMEHIDLKGFRSATNRERLMSERDVLSERLHRNKTRLAAMMERG